jgi:hypothetical protein
MPSFSIHTTIHRNLYLSEAESELNVNARADLQRMCADSSFSSSAKTPATMPLMA